MTLGEKLRKIRKEKDMTKLELSNELNVPKERIKLYELGEEEPSDFYLTIFAKYFNTSVDELLKEQ
ncbi:MAG: helix-turn-helix domain-containing protein [Sedimentibacter sp.]